MKSSDFDLVSSLSRFADPKRITSMFKYSCSQLRQDVFVLSVLNFKSKGFFVEFGATNGIDLSNTYLLEKHFGWNGILCEPAKIWHKDLTTNRDAVIDTSCVWTKSGQRLLFNETKQPELSSISNLSVNDEHIEARKNGKTYAVETVSLDDLLAKHAAPRRIDYMSIDTEGSELEILMAFSFQNYDISIITVEHNFTDSRRKIEQLLRKKGFVKLMESISAFEDWYVSEEIIESFT